MSNYKLPRHSDSVLERRKESRPETMEKYPRTGVRWSIEEEDILITLFQEESKQIYQIASELERNAGAIAARLEYLGLIGGNPSVVNSRSKKQPSYPLPSLTAYELGRKSAKKQAAKKQTAKKQTGNKKKKRSKSPDGKPLTSSNSKKAPPRYSEDGRPTGTYYLPRDRPTHHDGQKCKWCDGPLDLCACD